MYDFKRLEEMAWASLTAAAVFAVQVLTSFDPDTVTDWKTWAVSLGAGAVRAAAAAVLARIR